MVDTDAARFSEEITERTSRSCTFRKPPRELPAMQILATRLLVLSLYNSTTSSWVEAASQTTRVRGAWQRGSDVNFYFFSKSKPINRGEAEVVLFSSSLCLPLFSRRFARKINTGFAIYSLQHERNRCELTVEEEVKRFIGNILSDTEARIYAQIQRTYCTCIQTKRIYKYTRCS